MPGLNQTRLIDYLARSSAPDLVRRGPTEATITAVTPNLLVLLDDVTTAVPATRIGPPLAAVDVGKRALILEAGGGKRYFLGVING